MLKLLKDSIFLGLYKHFKVTKLSNMNNTPMGHSMDISLLSIIYKPFKLVNIKVLSELIILFAEQISFFWGFIYYFYCTQFVKCYFDAKISNK